MKQNKTLSEHFDHMARQRPALMWLVNALLTLLVTLVLITTTEAPVVLYQAF